MRSQLPVDDCLPDLVSVVRSGQPVILKAPPGAGKTTGVPPALIEGDCLPPGQVLLLQPRRIAARSAAHRLASQAAESIGQTYGYHVRFDRKTSSRTRVIAMTTGILLRRLTNDPLLENVGCVILDEFHERSLELDLVLGMLHRVRSTLRPELRLVVMSATLETEAVEALITDATTIESQGKAFEVEIRYDEGLSRQPKSRDAITEQVANCFPKALNSTDGDLLVFLPGVGEIHRTADAIDRVARQHSVEICKLYGDLSPSDQDAVIAASDSRKVVLATNIAETSITIPGTKCVIDTGLARVMRFDDSVGIPSLDLQPISIASADQRAGRAGRTAAGVCYRLWPSAMHRSRPEFTLPEVARSDLSAAVLCLLCWGERDVMAFPWVTPPTERSVDSAIQLLRQLDAIDEALSVTPTGVKMNEMPVHPRLSRLMIAATDYGCSQQASIAAALLSERDPFARTSGRVEVTGSVTLQSDLIERITALQQHINGTPHPSIHPAGAKNIARVASELQRLIKDKPVATDSSVVASDEEALSRAMLAAFPDRVAKRRNPDSKSGLMVGGRGVKLDRNSAVRTGPLFLCVNVDGKGEEALVRMASAIQPEWLPKTQLDHRQECFFHPTLKSVVARDRNYFLDLLISESNTDCQPTPKTSALLLENARPKLDQILPAKDKSLQSFLARWRFLSDHSKDGELPSDLSNALESVLGELCQTRTSFKELARAPWLDHLHGRFSFEQQNWFDQQAPETIRVPSGNQIRLEYPPGKPPVLAVRIQEIYGWPTTPRLAGGAVPLQLHLLGPNHRPQQITDDLESFWSTTYSVIKKDLKRRYSKHHWPDDPTTATATANGLKPR